MAMPGLALAHNPRRLNVERREYGCGAVPFRVARILSRTH